MTQNKKTTLIFGIIMACIIVIYSACDNLSSSGITTLGITTHEINYYHLYDTNDTKLNFRFDDKFKENLKKNVAIYNNLCTKMRINHQFKINEVISFNDPEGFEHYFFNNRNDLKDKIKIYIDSSASVAISPKYYKERRFIRIPYLDRNNISIGLHEIVHAIMAEEDQNIHLSDDGEIGDCDSTVPNYCMNLMTRSYFTPYNFLVTNSQREWINNLKYNGCDQLNGHQYIEINNEDFFNNDLIDIIGCSPRLDRIDKSKLPKQLQQYSQRKQFTLDWVCENLGLKTPCINLRSHNSQTSSLNTPYKKVLIAQNSPGNNAFAIYSKDIEDAATDLEIIRKFYFLNSEFYLGLLEEEARFATTGAIYIDSTGKSTEVNYNYVYNNRIREMETRFKGEKIRILSKLSKFLPKNNGKRSGNFYLYKNTAKFDPEGFASYQFQFDNGVFLELYANKDIQDKIKNSKEGVFCVEYDERNFITEIDSCPPSTNKNFVNFSPK